MSAANRGEARDPLDFAVTPAWAVRAILPHLGEPRTAIDLACGDGAIGKVLREAWGESLQLHGIELDRARATTARDLIVSVKPSFDPCRVYDEVYRSDALECAADDQDLVIANPPFERAADFLRIALGLVRPGGHVAFLLRAGWVIPKTRAHVPPCDLFFLRRRPSFKKSAKGNSTDASDYAWHVWGLGLGGRWSVLECEPARGTK